MTIAIRSESVILTTAMAVSGALIFLSLSGIRNVPNILYHSLHSHPSNNNSSSSSSSLRSCLCSDDKRREKRNSRKRVKFADDVKNNEGKSWRLKKNKNYKNNKKEIAQVDQLPANRAALYHGILRDHVRPHRIECSY